VRGVRGDEIQYVRAHDGLHIAYQVRGDGPVDLLEIGGFGALFPLDAADEQPRWHRFEDRLRRFARVIKLDLRGIGYSDQFHGTPTVGDWVADVIAVLDAVGAARVHVLASSFGGFAAIEVAATHPERVESLVLANTGARFASAPDYPVGISVGQAEEMSRRVEPTEPSDNEASDIDVMAPSIARDADIRRWWTRTAARGAGPATARAMWDISTVADVREHLPALRLPCLVLTSMDNGFVPPTVGRWLADHIAGAELCEIDTPDHVIWAAPDDLVVNEIERFLTGALTSHGGKRSIHAVLFTDIVESTAHNTARGDQAWLELLTRHDNLAAREIHNRGGRLVKRLGDGLLAVFPLASEAIDTALAVTAGAEELGIGVRAGVHVAEVEEVGDDVLGLGVTVAARVLGEADGGEVLTTQAVAELLTGSPFVFADRGRRALKGVAGEWDLAAATRSG
jgi:pimeloyl-ACP methyl ester carboxylesterase